MRSSVRSPAATPHWSSKVIGEENHMARPRLKRKISSRLMRLCLSALNSVTYETGEHSAIAELPSSTCDIHVPKSLKWFRLLLAWRLDLRGRATCRTCQLSVRLMLIKWRGGVVSGVDGMMLQYKEALIQRQMYKCTFIAVYTFFVGTADEKCKKFLHFS